MSDNEYAQLRSEVVNAVVTIGRDGRITGCESVSACDPRALRKVRGIVMEAPAWSPAWSTASRSKFATCCPSTSGTFVRSNAMRSTHGE